MKDLTVILPAHEISTDIKACYLRAVLSFKGADYDETTTLLVVGPDSVISELKEITDVKNAKFLASPEGCKNTFCELINFGVKHCETKYFSILEFDDMYTDIWFKNVENYLKHSDESIYLPLTEIYDYNGEHGQQIGFSNECVWASSFSNKIGYFDAESLETYLIFNATGGVFKKEDFEEVGGLKESMKLSFWLEFFLRMLNKEKTIFTIPKVGYQHFVNREGSLTSFYANMTDNEYDFWLDTAKKEYLFKKDRNKTYEE